MPAFYYNELRIDYVPEIHGKHTVSEWVENFIVAFVERFKIYETTDLSGACLVMGLESKNKFGEETKTHLHVRSYSQCSEDSHRKFVKEYFFEHYQIPPYKGEYCVKKSIKYPDDLRRWIRYCWKENRIKFMEILPEDIHSEETELEICAKDERRLQISKNIEKRDKDSNHHSTVYKIQDHIEKNKIKCKELRDVYRVIIQYMKDECMAINLVQVKAIGNTLGLILGVITEDYLLDQL